MNSDELRSEYLKFFESKEHVVLSSSSLIPIGDPTLLLTSAGVVQIKPFFTGDAVPPAPRLASCQKCFRATDIDSVGDADHLTFFEMLGNFSVADYFKKEAIEWAWEFSIEILKIPSERIWASIFLDDDESHQFWLDMGVPAERIVRYDESENWWGPPGDEGPCGPCTELYYDFGEEYACGKPDCGPACDCNRFTEYWNLVLTEYYQDREGNRTRLPSGNIDTGMGIERTAAVLQGVTNVYEADSFKEIMACVSRLTRKTYGNSNETDAAMRVVAEHGRSMTFLISDGVVPSNEGRGYVLRRILRRAVTFARKLGVEKLILSEIAQTVMKKMGHVYPELVQNREFILKVIENEESRFHDTLEAGLSLLDEITEKAVREKVTVVSGADVFRLYDTYGFPAELTEEVASERGFSMDMDGFQREMESQRQRGRAAQTFKTHLTEGETYGSLGLGATRFTGYETAQGESVVVGLLVEGQSVEKASKGDEAEVITVETPFYSEGGGQVGDRGTITGPGGVLGVQDTQLTMPGLITHKGSVKDGVIAIGDPVSMRVDPVHRRDATRNHTGTHLLHAALRKVLGEHVRQGGSLVAPNRLRFDFTHPVGLSNAELADVKTLTNDQIRANLSVSINEMRYTDAVASGALAFFGDKYGETVRVVGMGSGDRFSYEVCGGTHVAHTGEVWYLQVVDEGSIGSGLRRVEAVTGVVAQEMVAERFDIVDSLARDLNATPTELPERIAALSSDLDTERKRANSLERGLARREAEELVDQVQQVDGISLVAARVKAPNVESMREMGDLLKDRLNSIVIVLASVINQRPMFVTMVTPDLVDKGIHAGNIAKQVAAATGGGGGGRPELAQAGGKDPSKIGLALEAVLPAIKGEKG